MRNIEAAGSNDDCAFSFFSAIAAPEANFLGADA
jgi:hypothetical protein